MKSQKQAVIDEVVAQLPGFVQGTDNALLKLSAAQLETIKQNVLAGIQLGNIEYSKDKTLLAEVRPYARSMVMNHLKKAKELNGGFKMVTPAESGEPKTTRVKLKEAPKGVDPSLLPDDLKDFAKSLI